MKFISREKWILLLILILTLPGIKALAIPDLYTSHDGETHTARLANYSLALKEGQFPPRLAPTLFGGFGFPIFIFIYPLPYFTGSLFHSLGLTYTDSAELVMALSQVLSALAIYLFFKLETKNTLSSIVATLFFTWAPYRFLLIFVRGAFAESFAYIFIATTLITLNRLIITQKTRWIGLASLSLTGLLLSHQLVSAMFLPVLLWYTISKLITNKHWKQISIKIAIVVSLAFASSAFIYFPAFFERDLLRFDSLISYYQDHFVTFKQLVRSPWSYGFSHAGTAQDDVSFQIGLTHWVVAAISSIFILFSFFAKKTKTLKDSLNLKLVFWLVAFLLSIFVMLENPLTRMAWKNIPGLTVVDFPWRFLGVSVFAASMLTAYLLKKLNNNLLLVFFLVFFVFYSNRNHLRINKSVSYEDSYFENYPATATWQNEFLPKTRVTNKWQGIEGDYQVLKGQAQVKTNINKTHHLDLSINVSEYSEIIIHRLNFPQWNITLNNKQVSFEDSNISMTGAEVDLLTGVDTSGFIKVDLEPGQYHLVLKFTETPIRQLGFTLTLAGLATSLILSVGYQPFANHSKNKLLQKMNV